MLQVTVEFGTCVVNDNCELAGSGLKLKAVQLQLMMLVLTIS